MERPRPALAGIILAALLAVVSAAIAFFNPVPALVMVPVFAAGAWTLVRGSAWGGYGLALLLATGSLTSLWRAWEMRTEATTLAGLLILAAAYAIFAFVEWRAGASLGERFAWAGIAPYPWIALATATLVFGIGYQQFVTPTGSMEPTMMIGDNVMIRRVLLGDPGRGTLIAFRYPVDPKNYFVKRIIGIPGDRIRIARKKLFRNGVEQHEPYAVNKTDYMDTYRDNFPSEPNIKLYPSGEAMLANHVRDGEVVVPPGKYFVMGDNRDSSLDSRYWGFVDRDAIIGIPELIAFSVNEPATTLSGDRKPVSILHARWDRILKPL